MKLRIDWRLVVIMGVSILVRVGIALYLGDIVDAPPLLTDQRSYHMLGYRLTTGHGFSFPEAWYPFTPADTPTAHWSFLYSVFVAGVYAIFGPHPLAVRLIQSAMGGFLMPWMVYRLSLRVFGRGDDLVSADSSTCAFRATTISRVAAGVTAVYAYYILYAATLMTETFFIVAVLWSLEVSLAIVHALRDDTEISRSHQVQLGVSLGVATLLRQSILPWVPILAFSMLWVGRRRGRTGAVMRLWGGAGALLVLFVLPWTYRNYRVYDRFLLLNSNTGYAMYSAQHPIHGTSFQEFSAAPLPEGLGWGNEAALDSELMRLGLQFVFEDPVRYGLLSLSRIRAFFEFWPSPDTTILHNLGRVGSFGLTLPLMIYGLFLAWGAGTIVRRNGLLMLFVVFYSVMHILTWAMVRYRLPVDAVLMPVVGWALVDLGQRLRRLFAVRDRQKPEPQVEPVLMGRK